MSMKKLLEEAIELFGEEVDEKITNPAHKDLFTTYDGTSKVLDMKKSDLFHSIVAKLLYVMKRARPDIEPTIAFLMTRVSKSNERDWFKLKRLLGFIKHTIDDPRIIGATSLKDLYTWIDASYAVHHDMRGHTGGTMSMGLGIIHAKSSKQKLNVKSSTECEIVGASEYVPYNIWQMMFFEEQGYPLHKNVLFQDNQSAIKMEKNGRNSCTGNSRHVNIRYFVVKDRVDKGEIEIEYCPTMLMLADYFTKPLNGNLFKRLRNIIMGYVPISALFDEMPTSSFKERVGKSNISQNIANENVGEKYKNKPMRTWHGV